MSDSSRFPRFKVAAIQASPIIKDAPDWFDLPATLDKAASLITEAGRHGAKLIVFPECWIPGFTYWCYDFTDPANYRDLWASYLWNSVEVPGKETEAIS